MHDSFGTGLLSHFFWSNISHPWKPWCENICFFLLSMSLLTKHNWLSSCLQSWDIKIRLINTIAKSFDLRNVQYSFVKLKTICKNKTKQSQWGNGMKWKSKVNAVRFRIYLNRKLIFFNGIVTFNYLLSEHHFQCNSKKFFF